MANSFKFDKRSKTDFIIAFGKELEMNVLMPIVNDTHLFYVQLLIVLIISQ